MKSFCHKFAQQRLKRNLEIWPIVNPVAYLHLCQRTCKKSVYVSSCPMLVTTAEEQTLPSDILMSVTLGRYNKTTEDLSSRSAQVHIIFFNDPSLMFKLGICIALKCSLNLLILYEPMQIFNAAVHLQARIGQALASSLLSV